VGYLVGAGGAAIRAVFSATSGPLLLLLACRSTDITRCGAAGRGLR
jgi:hypothetical protein